MLLQKNRTNFVLEMKKKVFFILAIFSLHLNVFAIDSSLNIQCPNSEPLYEMRAVWLTTIGGRDWPHSYSQSKYSMQKQKQELCVILDNLSAAGINTVLLQTRIRATTIFPSETEPWDGCLSGTPGMSPGYDALAFAIEECHKRGIKLHAWVVALPVGNWNATGCKMLRKTVPHLLKKIGNEGFMNPEANGTANYLARFCRDLTQRYDIDGIHLDYIRYPDAWKKKKNKDKCRDNITNIVRAIHDAVKTEKPWVMLSCAPVGKYADTKRQCSNGWNARETVCQDAALWIEDGLMDALFPMMYFVGNNFYPFAIDWQERSCGKIITPGLGIYFLDRNEKDWPLKHITQEMHVLRQYGMGNSMFRSKFFTDNTKGLYDYTATFFSRFPSLQPAMTWYVAETPPAPQNISVSDRKGGTLLLSWTPSATYTKKVKTDDGKLLYNVYGAIQPNVDTKKAENLLMAAYDSTAIVIPRGKNVKYFAVTATDRYGNESLPCQLVSSEKSNEEIKNIPEIYGNILADDGKYVSLEGCGVTEGQLVSVSSIVGNELMLRVVKRNRSNLYIDMTGTSSGHYIVHLVNRKGFRHRLGMFSREVR